MAYLWYQWCSFGTRLAQSPEGNFLYWGKLFIASTYDIVAAVLVWRCTAWCLVLCHYTQGTYISAVCTFCRYNGCHCLAVRILHYMLLILCAFTTHFAYYYTMYHLSSHLSAVIHSCHLCRMATVKMLGHCHAVYPLECCLAFVKLLCLWCVA